MSEFSEITDPSDDSSVPPSLDDMISSLPYESTEDSQRDSPVPSAETPPDSDLNTGAGDSLAEIAEPIKKLPRVFISHKRDVAINDEIASRLKTDLEPLCESVYLDLDMLPGQEYVRVIEEELSNADFMIVLISEAANQSAWIQTELNYASFYYQQNGAPKIIPVRMGFSSDIPYNPFIDVHIGRIQSLPFDPINENYERTLLEPLRRLIEGIEENGGPPRERPEDRLAGFIVHESRRERLRAAFIEPPSLAGIRAQLRDRKLLWITGDAGVRNHLGISLAIDEGRERIYEISKPRSWTEINSSVVSNATIIFQDASPAIYFDESTPKAELDGLRSLVKRNNTVIVTMSEDAFQDVEPEIRREAFEYDARRRVDADTYGETSKLHIFRELLDLSLRRNVLHQTQYELALRLLETDMVAGGRHRSRVENRDRFLEIIRKCTPADIERFFTLHLKEVRKANDFVILLQLNAGGDEEIHSWFISLDDSTKCFVMTLALCSELDRKELWTKYKSIIQELKQLDPHLSLLPFGICRQRAMPYISTEGAIDFVNTRVANAINDEIAKHYREYLIELLPKLKEWSVPNRGHTTASGRTDERKREANVSQSFRAAIARLVGTAGKEELDDDIAGMLEYWATDPILKIREAVALALDQSVRDTDSANRALDLLKKWGSGAKNDERSFLKLYATAFPLTRFASSNSGQTVYLRALTYLKFLTTDARRSVRFYTSIAIRKMARKAQLVDLEVLLKALAHDNHLATRVNAAQAFNEARFGNEQEVRDLIQRWLASDDENLRWVAICSLLSSGNQARGRDPEEIERQIHEVQSLLAQDARTVASVLLELISDDRLKKNAWPLFRQLITEESTGCRDALIAGLAKNSFNQLDKKLFERLRRYGDPQHERLIIEIRKAYWKDLLATSGDSLTDLRERLGEEKRIVETFQTLTEMMRPEPEGDRQEIIEALVAFYPQDRELLDDVLRRLRSLAPSIFEPLCVEIRRAALRRLFYDPPTFVQILMSGLENTETFGEIYSALESMAQSERLGQRKELLQAFAYAYAVNPASVRSLLKLLRASGSRVLTLLSYEFTYNLLEGKLDSPGEFVAAILGALRNEAEQDEVLNVLQRFAMPASNGMKRRLVTSLLAAKRFDNAAVDALLQNQLLREREGLARLELDVRVASMLDNAFVPAFISRWFRPR